MLLLTPTWIFRLFVMQSVGIALIVFALPFSPPTAGRLLLIPVGAGDATRLVRDALSGGARLIDSGPIPGSLVVQGDRARLAATLGAVLIIAAPQAGCGSTGESA